MTSKNTDFEKTISCKNCGSTSIDNYCSNCGQKIYTKRFTLKNFLHVFLDAFNIEKGFIHTFILLFTKPGVLINDYINGKTKSYVNPLKYLLIIAGLFAFLMVTTTIIDTSLEKSKDFIYGSNEALQQQQDEIQTNTEALQFRAKFTEWFKNYINLIPLFLIPFTSLVTKWLYRSRKLFYGEFLIANCYMFAHTFVISIIFIIPLALIFPSLANYFPLLSFITTIIYLVYAFYKTFSSSPIISLVKAVSVYIIGALLFYLFFIILFVIFLIVISILGITIY
jgi:hypothetical protein